MGAKHLAPPDTSDVRARHELVLALNRKRYQEAEQSRQAAALSERAQAYDALVSQAAAVRAARSFEPVSAAQITDASLGIKSKASKRCACPVLVRSDVGSQTLVQPPRRRRAPSR